MATDKRQVKTKTRMSPTKAAMLVGLICVIGVTSFGGVFAVEKEKHFGQVFTPSYLVQDILDVAGYSDGNPILQKHVIDNACGDGAFLEEVVRRYCKAFGRTSDDKRLLAAQLGEYVHGIEIDVAAYEACVVRMNDVATELELPKVSWDLRNADTLTISDYDGRMDFVVGNPPYVRVHNLAENFGKVKKYAFCTGGMTDLYLVFYEIGLGMLSPTGKLCYIAPSSWINSLAGSNMREFVRSKRCLCGIVDLGHYQPFDATAYTAIVTLDCGGKRDVFSYGVYDGPHSVRTVCDLKYEEAFFDNALYLGDPKTLRMQKEITTTEVPKYVQVKNGFATLSDSIFIRDEFPFTVYVIPTLKASTGKWRKAFFPYDTSGKPIVREKLFADEAIRKFLEENRNTLLKGKNEKRNPDWYLYGRTQALKDVSVGKYAINTCIKDVKSIKFNFVPAGSGVYSGLYILTDVPEKTLREILLSQSFIDYVAVLKKYKSGGYYTFSSHDLQQYLNYEIDKRMPTTKRRIRQSSMDI